MCGVPTGRRYVLGSTSRDLACHAMLPEILSYVNLRFPRLVILHFSLYSPRQGHAKVSSQYWDRTSGRTGFSLSSGLDARHVPETAARTRSLVDVVGSPLGVKRLGILLVNGHWSSLPDSHLVAAMDFPDRRVAILHSRPLVFFL